MTDIDSIIIKNGDFTFEEAAEYFGDKIPITLEEFNRLSEEYRSLAFTVSDYTGVQILRLFHEELLGAIESGETEESFRQKMNTFLEDKGYKGLTPFRCDTIFRTNVQTAYQVGHYEQMTKPEVLRLRPYWQYVAVADKATRPSHLAMDGRVFPADDPVWDTWYPPNGFKCRCTVTSLSERQVEERGLKVETEIPRAAELATGRFVNILPDQSFKTNPAKTRFSPNLKDYPEALVKAYTARQKSSP